MGLTSTFKSASLHISSMQISGTSATEGESPAWGSQRLATATQDCGLSRRTLSSCP